MAGHLIGHSIPLKKNRGEAELLRNVAAALPVCVLKVKEYIPVVPSWEQKATTNLANGLARE
jgi:hypothetical protein